MNKVRLGGLGSLPQVVGAWVVISTSAGVRKHRLVAKKALYRGYKNKS